MEYDGYILVGGDWKFGTMEFYDFPYVGNVIIPTDFNSMIFQRGCFTPNISGDLNQWIFYSGNQKSSHEIYRVFLYFFPWNRSKMNQDNPKMGLQLFNYSLFFVCDIKRWIEDEKISRWLNVDLMNSVKRTHGDLTIRKLSFHTTIPLTGGSI